MMNRIYYYYKLFSQSSNTIFTYYCLSLRKDSNNIVLQNPQLIYPLNLNKENYNIRSSAINLDLTSHSGQQDMNSSLKFERKNKSDFLLSYDAITKKNRILNKRKQRNKRVVDTEDLFMADAVIESDVESLEIELVKPVKSRKQKKKYQAKHNIDVNQLNDSLQEIDKCRTKDITNQDDDISKIIVLDAPLKIKHLADKMKISEASIITWLFLQGISVTINQVVDIAIASKVAKHYNFTILHSDSSKPINNIESTTIIEKHQKTVERAPIITIFGHVDHGKTTLLDSIRKTNIASKEMGGITQSITGYQVSFLYMNEIKNLIFLDTPGHQAFASMRLRGMEVTDIAILLVAADDGLRPQSIEAISHIKSRKIPYLVAVNKIDKEDTNIDKIRDQLSQHGIIDIDWGGDANIVAISALKSTHIDTLLSKVCQLSNSLNLRTSLNNYAEGIIVEAYLNKTTGPIAIVVLKNGILHVGDIIVSGNIYGKVKLIINSEGLKVNSATASAIIKISGFSSVPQTGLRFHVVDSEKVAKNIINQNHDSENNDKNTKLLNTRVTLESYKSDSNLKTVNVILKADTQGSIEAIIHAFSQIPQDKVQINIISCSSGSVFYKDIDLAITSQSVILVFNVNVLSSIRSSAEKSNIIIRDFNVIYDLLDYIQKYMLNLVKPEYDKVHIGQAVVQTVFNINQGIVAGCFVKSGVIKQGSYIVIYRQDHVIYEGILTSLKRLKNSVDEVMEGHECGIMCKNYSLWQKFDTIEAFQMIEKQKIL